MRIFFRPIYRLFSYESSPRLFPNRSIIFNTRTTMASSTNSNDQSGHAKTSNRLIKERSPYLLQHAHNPVDWYPWGAEAFEKAKNENKMIFLSVGYSTCHWCHVMERESFEDPRIGQLMNERFVNIKVDREERPDVDKLYMTFVQATTGGGGWPMSVWLTPDLKPIVGGTYFPPGDSSFGRPGFSTVLKYVSDKWRESRETVMQQGEGLAEAISAMGRLSTGANELPGSECVDKCYKQIADTFDATWGGFGSAPKFPQPVNFDVMLRCPNFNKSKANGTKLRDDVTKMVGFTLKKMAAGGIHDIVSQGFHRYSTDRKWHVPHFEKMLYDQGQLAVTFAEMYQITKDEFYAETLRDILTYVDRDLGHPSGGFYSAEDADSYPIDGDKEKKEGAFCVWTHDELKRSLNEPVSDGGGTTTMADVFIKHYGVKKEGNVDPHQDPHGELTGKNVLIVFGSVEATADAFKMSVDDTKRVLDHCRKVLFEIRQQRPRPHLDTKMLTAWNGLMISGFAKAAGALNDQAYRDRAINAVEFVRKNLYDSEKKMLLRSCYTEDRRGVIQIPKPIYGFADDYAFLITALLDLYECTFDDQWLKWASELQAKMDQLFWDGEGRAYFQAAVGDPSIIVRLKEDNDGAEPSANSMASMNLLRLAEYLDDPTYREKAKETMAAFGDHLRKIPVAVSKMVCALMFHLSGGGQIVIVGEESEETRALLNAVNKEFLPFKILIALNGKTDSWLKSVNKHLGELKSIDGKPTAYVCKDFSCSSPVHDVDGLKKVLGV